MIAIDVCLNVLFFDGLLGETISAHSARASQQGEWWGWWLSWGLDWIEPDHGAKAEQADLDRAEEVVETEDKAEKLK